MFAIQAMLEMEKHAVYLVSHRQAGIATCKQYTLYLCFTDDDSCPRVCDQHCILSDNARICACDHGYYLDADNHTCRGDLIIVDLAICTPIILY